MAASVTEEFENFLLVFHYLTISSVCHGLEELEMVSTKAVVSLLRYTNVYPADKAFYQAGVQAKVKHDSLSVETVDELRRTDAPARVDVLSRREKEYTLLAMI